MNRREHIMTCIAEECSEIQKIITKSLRFGLHDFPPGKERTNLQHLREEVIDLIGTLAMLESEDGVEIFFEPKEAEIRIGEKIQKVERYMKYAERQGTLNV